jgi:hypothetical protein
LFLVCPESRTFLSLGSSTFNSMPEWFISIHDKFQIHLRCGVFACWLMLHFVFTKWNWEYLSFSVFNQFFEQMYSTVRVQTLAGLTPRKRGEFPIENWHVFSYIIYI